MPCGSPMISSARTPWVKCRVLALCSREALEHKACLAKPVALVNLLDEAAGAVTRERYGSAQARTRWFQGPRFYAGARRTGGDPHDGRDGRRGYQGRDCARR